MRTDPLRAHLTDVSEVTSLRGTLVRGWPKRTLVEELLGVGEGAPKKKTGKKVQSIRLPCK